MAQPSLPWLRRCVTLIIIAVCATPVASAAADTLPANKDIERVILDAGNADADEVRLQLLRKARETPGLDETLSADLNRMIAAIERWTSVRPDASGKRLAYFSRDILDRGTHDFGLSPDSPLAPIALLYEARMHLWVTLEYGGFWSDPAKRRKQFDKVRPMFEELRTRFPENRIVRMYLGEPFPPEKQYPAPPDAPEWAVHQREALERLTDIITWWIDNRFQENGEYGGGWGDDCEMWRWWVPVLIGFEDPKIVAAQARFSKALLDQPHMAQGYTEHVYDVEHTSEDSSDALTPMMHLDPDSAEWSDRAIRLADLMEQVWTGVNERGSLQFKSTYFSATKVDPDPRKACDTVYHPRALQPALLYWQRTGDQRLTKLFSAWMDTWVDAAARAERGKPAGILPSAIHWPDGGIGGQGQHWWDPENHTKDPLYVWPSAMGQMTSTLLLTHHMTKDPKYLEPIRTMAQARLDFLTNPPAEPYEPGSEAWCAARLGGLRDVLAKHKLLTGATEFDALLMSESGPYATFRLRGIEAPLVDELRRTAEALRINFPGYTGEVRYTDRVLRLPRIFGANGIFPDAVEGIPVPNTANLYSTVTGDPGGGLYFPVNAVRWLTPPRQIAILVTDAATDRFEALLYHFGADPRPMAAEFYLLAPGNYRMTVTADEDALVEKEVVVNGRRARADLELPPRRLCRLTVAAP